MLDPLQQQSGPCPGQGQFDFGEGQAARFLRHQHSLLPFSHAEQYLVLPLVEPGGRDDQVEGEPAGVHGAGEQALTIEADHDPRSVVTAIGTVPVEDLDVQANLHLAPLPRPEGQVDAGLGAGGEHAGLPVPLMISGGPALGKDGASRPGGDVDRYG